MSRGPGKLQQAILAVLTDKPRTTQEVADRLEGRWRDDIRQVRRALDSLHQRGLISKDWLREPGWPDRSVWTSDEPEDGDDAPEDQETLSRPWHEAHHDSVNEEDPEPPYDPDRPGIWRQEHERWEARRTLERARSRGQVVPWLRNWLYSKVGCTNTERQMLNEVLEDLEDLERDHAAIGSG